MTEGSTQDDDEGEKGPDLFAHVPGYQTFQQEPVWPGQQPSPPAKHHHPSHNPVPAPAPSPNSNPASGPASHPASHPTAQPASPEEGEGGRQLAFPEAAPLLQLPTKPKTINPQNLPLTRLPQSGEAAGYSPGAPGSAGFPGGPGGPGVGKAGTTPAAAGPWGGGHQTTAQPGQANPGFTPPTPAPYQENAGFVPSNAGAPQVNPGPTQKSKLNEGAPIITSASAKPNWTQPQWPTGQALAGPQGSGFGVLARRSTGTRLPPAIAPLPEAPYSQAPPTSGNVQRNLFAGHQDQSGNPANLNYANASQTHQGLKQLPFTIQRDLILSKQLFGDQLNRPATKERREYKQTEYIPKAPVLKVAKPDPVQPWKPVPAATYEFFPEEEKPQPNPRNSIHGLDQQKKDVQFARGFNPANPLGFDDGEGQPDPRYAPFQGELIKDIALQDKRTGLTEDPIPAETRVRGKAALRALGRNSDHYYDTHPADGTQEGELPQAVRLNSRDLFGLATYYFIVTKEVLTSPQTFFANMSLVGGLNDPLLYLAFASLMTGAFNGVATLNLLTFFFSVIFSFLTVAVGAVVAQFAFKRLGGQGKFEQTFNVLAYSRATFIFAWISLGHWPIGMVLAAAFTAYLNYLGLTRVHKLSTKTTWLVIGVMMAVPLLLKIKMY